MLNRSMRALLVGLCVLAGSLLGACTGGGGNGNSAPVIAIQPADTSVPSGQTASFSVVAVATPAPSYQWRRNGADIAGATSTSYVTPVVAIADGGAVYTVAVSNTQGAVVSTPATLGVTPVTSADKRKLLDVMTSVMQFYLAGLTPFELQANSAFLEPTSVCLAGTGSAMLNGTPVFVGQQMPDTATVSATFNGCTLADGTVVSGTGLAAFDFPQLDLLNGHMTLTLNQLRRTTLASGVVDTDYTSNGDGAILAVTASSATEDSVTAILTPAVGATLHNELSGLTSTFTAGSFTLVGAVDNTTGNVRVRYSYDDLGTNMAGVAYLASGFNELTFSVLGASLGGSGEVVFSAGGTTLGRLYATAAGVFIEVDGVSLPLKAPSGLAVR